MAAKIELESPPSDGITAVRFAPSSYNILASSWDKTVRLWDAGQNKPIQVIATDAPVLDACFSSENRAYSGGVDKSVRCIDFETGSQTLIGSHDGGVKSVSSLETGAIASGSWDKTVRVWDPASNTCIGVHNHPDKVFAMSATENHLIVATAGRHVWVWDLRNMSGPQQRRESSLKYQTRSVRAMPNHQGFALGSIEGRVAVEYIDTTPEMQKKKFAFKCHREKSDNGDIIYPVNALAFHPVEGTFATGGCDGYVNVWDAVNRKRIFQFQKYDTSIASLDFSHDGEKLAVAVSYTMEQGEKPHPPDAIHVRDVQSKQVQPKKK